MPQFILLCRDKDGGLPIRQETRPAHLDFIKSYGDKVLLAGPLLNDAGDHPVGSMIIVEVADAAAAKEFADNDPYAKAGLFRDVEICPYKIVTGTLTG